jgi:hypothetical protein
MPTISSSTERAFFAEISFTNSVSAAAASNFSFSRRTSLIDLSRPIFFSRNSFRIPLTSFPKAYFSF